jgi:acetyl esterase
MTRSLVIYNNFRAALLLPQLYREFANGTFLTSKTMAWLGLLSARDGCARAEITASPLRPGLDDLAGPAGGAGDGRRERRAARRGDAYARKLTAAGVRTTSVRSTGSSTIPIRDTAATELATMTVRKVFGQ